MHHNWKCGELWVYSNTKKSKYINCNTKLPNTLKAKETMKAQIFRNIMEALKTSIISWLDERYKCRWLAE